MTPYPGRDLDTKLAVLLGWTKEFKREYGGEIQNCDIWFAPDRRWSHGPPQLSTTYEGMGTILEAMRKRCFACQIVVLMCTGDDATFRHYGKDGHGDGDWHAHWSDTPGAVALAAYNALSGTAEVER